MERISSKQFTSIWEFRALPDVSFVEDGGGGHIVYAKHLNKPLSVCGCLSDFSFSSADVLARRLVT